MNKKWKGGLSERPSWDVYFLTKAFLTSQRSMDESTVHGSILVSEDNRVLAEGYNGPLPGCNDAQLPQERPYRYNWVIHSEENTVAFCDKPELAHTLYITGEPCHKCLKSILLKARNLKRIVHGMVGSHMIHQDLDCAEFKAKKIILDALENPPPIECLDIKDDILALLERTASYVRERG